MKEWVNGEKKKLKVYNQPDEMKGDVYNLISNVLNDVNSLPS